MTERTWETFGADPRENLILDILAKETESDRASMRPETTIEELGIASLDLTVVVFQLESVFDIEIPVIADQPGQEFGTVGELVAHVIAAIDRASAEKLAPPKLSVEI